MEVFLILVVIIGAAVYMGWRSLDKFEDKKEGTEAPVVTNRVEVVDFRAPVTEAPAVAEPAPVVETPPEVKKARATAKRVKAEAAAVAEPAKVAKVKRQYTKKAKE